MGISLEFYAGDAKTIALAFDKEELDGLRDGTAAQCQADFSLHLSPMELELLSEVLAERCGVPGHIFYDCVGPPIAGQLDESGAHLVDPKWVKMVAAADSDA